jgi:hypothetical protein
VVGCTLHYQDINVTSTLKVNKTARLCNSAWVSYVAFDKVACINGSVLAPYTGLSGVRGRSIPETEAMALVELLKAVDPDVNSSWAVSKKAVFGFDHYSSQPLTTARNFIVLFWWSALSDEHPSKFKPLHVTDISLDVTDGPTQPLSRHPTLNEHMVAALMNFPKLRTLYITVGGGELLPQLGSLAELLSIHITHFCLRGRFPVSLLVSWKYLETLAVSRESRFKDPADGAPCGISGTLPTHLPSSSCGIIDLCNNQLTGRLPLNLLTWGERQGTMIRLNNNQLTGPLPACHPDDTITTWELSIANNNLEVSGNCRECRGVMFT